MRMLIIAASAIGTLIFTMAWTSNDTQAAVCGRGVYRAGCVGPRGAVGVRRSYYGGYRGGVYRRGYYGGRVYRRY